jgi:hypothetical protein
MAGMKLFAGILLYLFSSLAASSQDTNYIKRYILGGTRISILGTCYNDYSRSISLLNVHDDENTSVEAAEQHLQQTGGMLTQLKHSGKRSVVFKLQGKGYAVDPNRIFTAIGIKNTLLKFGRYSSAAAREVKRFADTLLRNHVDDKKLVVALHNNTDEGFSILSYQPGGTEALNAEKVYNNPEMDADDFVLTTDSCVFERLQEKQINVILQDNKKVKDDGSLSVYTARKKIPYINVEAQDGHLEEQVKLLEALQEVIDEHAAKDK